MGLAVARELRARGATVAVLERDGVGAGASGVQPGGVRQQWGTRVACRLARESVAFWRNADAHLTSHVPLTLRSGGYLFVAQSNETLAVLEANVRLQNDEGVPSRIVTAAEAAEIVPGLVAVGIAGGAWCEEDGYFDHPQAVVEAFAHGIEVRRARVEAIRRDGDGWLLETGPEGSIAADTVVVAAGVEFLGQRPAQQQAAAEPQ